MWRDTLDKHNVAVPFFICTAKNAGNNCKFLEERRDIMKTKKCLILVVVVLIIIAGMVVQAEEKGEPTIRPIKGIVYSEEHPYAIIGTQIVGEGDTIDGVKVIKIYKDKVEYEKDGKRWTQELSRTKDPNNKGGSRYIPYRITNKRSAKELSEPPSPPSRKELQIPKEYEELIEEKKRRMKEREQTIKNSRRIISRLRSYSIDELQIAIAVKVIDKYQGATVISAEKEPRYLGTISNEFDMGSIFNRFGLYGSKYAVSSIWNQFSSYGFEFSQYSPFNDFSTDPPIIIKDSKVIGRLTVNKLVPGGVDPGWLRFYFTY